MANGENRGDVARALIAHTLNVTAHSLADKARPGMMTRQRKIGDFLTSHTVIAGQFDVVDVWHGNKVFSARRHAGVDSWEIVNFKRGEWESGFLCAA